MPREYKIAIVANMSAGKSTFINAMFADNLLPAYSMATTDCPVYIYSDHNPYNNRAIVEFLDGSKITIDSEDVKKELKFYAKKDTDDLDEKYRSVKKIDLHWDFYTLRNSEESRLAFTIIDTPGPNNTDEYQEKHQSITKQIILNEANMVLYLFDYGQIDSNLEATKENIWGLIQQRKEKDKNFEVFFVINKIDMALEDNENLSTIRSAKTKEEFYQKLKEFWFYHEQKAVDKIKASAMKYGFPKPKVFTTSAEYQKFSRMKEISSYDKGKIDVVKSLFKEMFQEQWEEELLKYLHLDFIEDATRVHLEDIENKMLVRRN